MDNTNLQDDRHSTPQDEPQDLELDESYDEQKSKVDAWEEDMKKEREERSKAQ